jgi:hypothetical protein
MLESLSPLAVLPQDFQLNWQAVLNPAAPNPNGSFKVVKIRRTAPKTFEELRIIALVVDENGFPLSGVKVAFSYSTANQYLVGTDFTWTPPTPHRADIFPTEGSGQIEHIQGSVVQSGQPGGITVYVVEPGYSSDYISGAGALADHTGMHITFQLRRPGVVPLADRLSQIEARLAALEGKV